MADSQQNPERFSLFPTPLGECGISWRGNAVVATNLPERTRAATAARLAARPGAAEAEPSAEIEQAISLITALLEGERTDLSGIVCDFSGVDPFSVRVYSVTRGIAAGETRTYGDIASQLGDSQLARKVGRALGKNPIPIIVPCHRVIGAKNQLTGFSAYGGIETKLRMLSIERARFGNEPGLFDDIPLPVQPPE